MNLRLYDGQKEGRFILMMRPAPVIQPKPTNYQNQLSLLDRDLFGGILHLFFLRQEKFQHTVVILSLNAVAVDLVIKIKAALEAPERKFFAYCFVLFRLGFFFLFKADGQLTPVYSYLEIFLATAGSTEFQVVGISRFMNVYRGKTKTFFLSETGRKALEEFIHKMGETSLSVVVNFYECHGLTYLSFIISFDGMDETNGIPPSQEAL